MSKIGLIKGHHFGLNFIEHLNHRRRHHRRCHHRRCGAALDFVRFIDWRFSNKINFIVVIWSSASGDQKMLKPFSLAHHKAKPPSSSSTARRQTCFESIIIQSLHPSGIDFTFEIFFKANSWMTNWLRRWSFGQQIYGGRWSISLTKVKSGKKLNNCSENTHILFKGKYQCKADLDPVL